MRATLLIIFVITHLHSVGQTKYPDHYKTDLFDGVLFGKGDNIFVKSKAADPTRKEVQAAEYLLPAKIDSIQNDFNLSSKIPINIEVKFTGYKRQYFAFKNESGQKIIIISFYYSPRQIGDNKLTIIPRIVNDGWDNNWRICYNTITHQFFDFEVNSVGG